MVETILEAACRLHPGYLWTPCTGCWKEFVGYYWWQERVFSLCEKIFQFGPVKLFNNPTSFAGMVCGRSAGGSWSWPFWDKTVASFPAKTTHRANTRLIKHTLRNGATFLESGVASHALYSTFKLQARRKRTIVSAMVNEHTYIHRKRIESWRLETAKIERIKIYSC